MTELALLDTVEGLLRRTYRMHAPIEGIGAFVIGDRGYRTFYDHGAVETVVGSRTGPGARTLVRETADGLRAAIYFPDAMIRRLEEHPPQHGLGDRNVDAFAALIEEADHLLCLAERAAEGRPVTLFELELHANVSKHLVLSRFLAGSGHRLREAERVWLLWHLFHKGTWEEEDPRVRTRYADAARWAIRFLEGSRALGRAVRLDLLRRFHSAGAGGKLRLISALA